MSELLDRAREVIKSWKSRGGDLTGALEELSGAVEELSGAVEDLAPTTRKYRISFLELTQVIVEVEVEIQEETSPLSTTGGLALGAVSADPTLHKEISREFHSYKRGSFTIDSISTEQTDVSKK